MYAERIAMNKTVLLVLASILILIGVIKPNLNFPITKPNVVENIVVVTPPSDEKVRELCEPIVEALSNGSSSRNKDGKRLSDLYFDLATLIELDGENEVVKTTEEIRQANSLSGLMLRLNIKGEYPGLTEAAYNFLVAQIGDDIVPLDSNLRSKAVDTFKALAWACNEGSK
jgi:hypothetical protein